MYFGESPDTVHVEAWTPEQLSDYVSDRILRALGIEPAQGTQGTHNLLTRGDSRIYTMGMRQAPQPNFAMIAVIGFAILMLMKR